MDSKWEQWLVNYLEPDLVRMLEKCLDIRLAEMLEVKKEQWKVSNLG